ncbi:MAG TPA: hypothetical protein VM347_28865 [Nonomuraea sp.]|nr:hypothetical protein [Nonomuraea sp.]
MFLQLALALFVAAAGHAGVVGTDHQLPSAKRHIDLASSLDKPKIPHFR